MGRVRCQAAFSRLRVAAKETPTEGSAMETSAMDGRGSDALRLSTAAAATTATVAVAQLAVAAALRDGAAATTATAATEAATMGAKRLQRIARACRGCADAATRLLATFHALLLTSQRHTTLPTGSCPGSGEKKTAKSPKSSQKSQKKTHASGWVVVRPCP